MLNGVNQCCEPLDCVELGNNPAYPGITRYFCMEIKVREDDLQVWSIPLILLTIQSPVRKTEIVEAAGHAVVHLDVVVT